MSAKNVETFRQAHEAFNRRDFTAVGRLLADQFRYEDYARRETFSGRSGFTEFMQAWVTAFSNAAVTAPTYIDGGDVVVSTFVGRGRNDGPLGPFPPSGKELDLQFCEIMRFDAAGQIVSGGIYYDQLTLLKQMGQTAAVAQ